jgi:hypothetical protein
MPRSGRTRRNKKEATSAFTESFKKAASRNQIGVPGETATNRRSGNGAAKNIHQDRVGDKSKAHSSTESGSQKGAPLRGAMLIAFQ